MINSGVTWCVFQIVIGDKFAKWFAFCIAWVLVFPASDVSSLAFCPYTANSVPLFRGLQWQLSLLRQFLYQSRNMTDCVNKPPTFNDLHSKSLLFAHIQSDMDRWGSPVLRGLGPFISDAAVVQNDHGCERKRCRRRTRPKLLPPESDMHCGSWKDLPHTSVWVIAGANGKAWEVGAVQAP